MRASGLGLHEAVGLALPAFLAGRVASRAPALAMVAQAQEAGLLSLDDFTAHYDARTEAAVSRLQKCGWSAMAPGMLPRVDALAEPIADFGRAMLHHPSQYNGTVDAAQVVLPAHSPGRGDMWVPFDSFGSALIAGLRRSSRSLTRVPTPRPPR